jgi:hypothetical protein
MAADELHRCYSDSSYLRLPPRRFYCKWLSCVQQLVWLASPPQVLELAVGEAHAPNSPEVRSDLDAHNQELERGGSGEGSSAPHGQRGGVKGVGQEGAPAWDGKRYRRWRRRRTLRCDWEVMQVMVAAAVAVPAAKASPSSFGMTMRLPLQTGEGARLSAAGRPMFVARALDHQSTIAEDCKDLLAHSGASGSETDLELRQLDALSPLARAHVLGALCAMRQVKLCALRCSNSCSS